MGVGTVGRLGVGAVGSISAVGTLAILGLFGLLLGNGNGHARHTRRLGVVANLFTVLGNRNIGGLGRGDLDRGLGRVLLLKGTGCLGAKDRFTVDLDLDPGGLALGNGDLDLDDLVLFLFRVRLGGIGISRIRRLVGVFILVNGFGLLGRLLGSMQSPIANFARVIKQIAEKDGEGAAAE